jgi:hypothetical protein
MMEFSSLSLCDMLIRRRRLALTAVTFLSYLEKTLSGQLDSFVEQRREGSRIVAEQRHSD